MGTLTAPLFILTILCLNIVISEWLVARTFCRHFGTALLVILLTAVWANLGVIPSASNASPLYDVIFSYVAPIGIFFLLLEVNLKNLRRAGLPMLLLFLLGAIATALGAVIGMWAVSGKSSIGPLYRAIGGMFTGTYIGGSINFNAIALHYEVTKDGTLYAGAIAVDNILTTLWMIVTIAVPKLFPRVKPQQQQEDQTASGNGKALHHDESEALSPLSLSLLLGLGMLALWISNLTTALFARAGITIPAILILTTIALALAQMPVFSRVKGARLLGLFCVYLFLAVIGAYCELSALSNMGTLGLTLLLFVTVLVLVHGVVLFGFGAIFKQDWDMVAIASQANIGGSTSALALAKSLNRRDLYLPAILVGSLGNGIGTYLGFLVIKLI